MRVLALLGSVAMLTGASVQGASLRLLDEEPLTVRGLGFKPNERVKLLVSAPPTSFSRTLRAGARGGFVVRFRLAADRCTSVNVQAIGARGSRAALHLDTAGCVAP